MVTTRAAQLLDVVNVGRVRLLDRKARQASRCGHLHHLGQAALRLTAARSRVSLPQLASQCGLALDRAERHSQGRQADLAVRLLVEGVGDGTVQPTGNEVLRRGAEELGKGAAVLVRVALVHHHDTQAHPVRLADLMREASPSIADEGFFAEVEKHVGARCRSSGQQQMPHIPI